MNLITILASVSCFVCAFLAFAEGEFFTAVALFGSSSALAHIAAERVSL